MEPKIDKQKIFLKYLMARLGFGDDLFSWKYLIDMRFRSWHSDLISFVLDEYQIKRKLLLQKRQIENFFISATDISSFTYCPASYSIAKTYEIPPNVSAKNGIALHEDSPILNALKPQMMYGQPKGEKPFFGFDSFRDSNKDNIEFFDNLASSELIFSGHTKDVKREYFTSAKGKYVGQPDYIFKDSLGKYYVVEEKFRVQSDSNIKKSFFVNHVNQLVSYLHGISHYDLTYGYLIYWDYEYKNGRFKIRRCNVRKVIKSDATRIHIIDLYRQIEQFRKAGVVDFDISKRNPTKCANCVATLLCGHKTGNFEKLEFPYSTKYYKLKSVPFPDELKRIV